MNFLTNSRILLNYYANDAFHGIFQQRWLRNRFVRTIVLAFLVCTYVAYLALNFMEANRLRKGIVQQSAELIAHGFRMIVAPVITMNAVFGVLVSIVVFLTFSLTMSSLYVSRTLVFSRSEASFAQRLMKLGFASFIFLFLFAVESSAITVVPISAPVFCAMFFLAYVIFVFFYIVADLLLSVLSLPKGIVGSIVFGVGVVVLFGSVLYFFFAGRYSVDWWINTLPLSTQTLIGLFIALGFVCDGLALAISRFSLFDMRSRERKRYIKTPVSLLRFRSGVSVIIAAFVREKLFLVFFGLDIAVAAYCIVKYGYAASASFVPFILGTFSVAGIRYADTMLSLRPVLKTLRWSALREAIIVTAVYTIFLLPTIIMVLSTHSDPTIIAQYYSLFFLAVIIGFFFPKSAGVTNETVSAVVLVCALIALVFIAKISFLLPIVTIVLWAGMLATLITETEKKI